MTNHPPSLGLQFQGASGFITFIYDICLVLATQHNSRRSAFGIGHCAVSLYRCIAADSRPPSGIVCLPFHLLLRSCLLAAAVLASGSQVLPQAFDMLSTTPLFRWPTWHALWRGAAYVFTSFLGIFRPLVARLAPPPPPSLVDVENLVSTEGESQKARPKPPLYFILNSRYAFNLTLVLYSVPLPFPQETVNRLSHA